MELPQPTAEHEFLKRFTGDWKVTHEQMAGTEHGRMMGDVWLLLEGRGLESEGGHNYLFTIGFDTRKGKFVGSFVCNMTTEIWVYEGELEGEKLVLRTRGQAFDGSGEANFRDSFFFEGSERMLTSHMEQPDGTWVEFMRASSTPASL